MVLTHNRGWAGLSRAMEKRLSGAGGAGTVPEFLLHEYSEAGQSYVIHHDHFQGANGIHLNQEQHYVLNDHWYVIPEDSFDASSENATQTRPNGNTVIGIDSTGGNHPMYAIFSRLVQYKYEDMVKWLSRIRTSQLGVWEEASETGQARLYHGFLGLPNYVGSGKWNNMTPDNINGSGIFPIVDGTSATGPPLIGIYTEQVDDGAPVWNAVVRNPSEGATVEPFPTITYSPNTWYKFRIEKLANGDLRFYIKKGAAAEVYVTIPAASIGVPKYVPGQNGDAYQPWMGKVHAALGSPGEPVAVGDTLVHVDYDTSKFKESDDAPVWLIEE